VYHRILSQASDELVLARVGDDDAARRDRRGRVHQPAPRVADVEQHVGERQLQRPGEARLAEESQLLADKVTVQGCEVRRRIAGDHHARGGEVGEHDAERRPHGVDRVARAALVLDRDGHLLHAGQLGDRDVVPQQGPAGKDPAAVQHQNSTEPLEQHAEQLVAVLLLRLLDKTEQIDRVHHARDHEPHRGDGVQLTVHPWEQQASLIRQRLVQVPQDRDLLAQGGQHLQRGRSAHHLLHVVFADRADLAHGLRFVLVEEVAQDKPHRMFLPQSVTVRLFVWYSTMWPCTANAASGVDFTLFMTSDTLCCLGRPAAPAGGEWVPPDNHDCITCLRVPVSMRAAFEVLARVYPDQVRALQHRQNWQLLRDSFCLRCPSVVPQGIGYPRTEPVCEADADFVNDDVPVRTDQGVWGSNGDFRFFEPGDVRLAAPFRTRTDYAHSPWSDAMSTATRNTVRRILDGWRGIVDERNRIGMYVPSFVIPGAGGSSGCADASAVPKTRFFGQFFHREGTRRPASPPPPPPSPPRGGRPVRGGPAPPPQQQPAWNMYKRRRNDERR
jgi:hypothetical protein